MTEFALRWIKMVSAKEKREDGREGIAFGIAAFIGIVGAYLNRDLASW